jgi:thiol-disulfide isomerase/thioredoxin
LVAHVTGAGLPTPLPLAPGNGHHGRHQGLELASGLKLGEAAPPLSFPGLDGRMVVLADFKGRETLVLFWNPACGFCSRMLPDLKEWEADRAAGAPELLVISTGTEEANRSMGLRSTVALDQAFLGGAAFGVQGTPSAVLVDAEGKIASPVAVGAQAILTLAGANLSKAGA